MDFNRLLPFLAAMIYHHTPGSEGFLLVSTGPNGNRPEGGGNTPPLRTSSGVTLSRRDGEQRKEGYM